MKEANPELGVTDLAKLQGATWKELDESQKQKYADLAAQDVLRYKAEMEEGGFFELERIQKEKEKADKEAARIAAGEEPSPEKVR